MGRAERAAAEERQRVENEENQARWKRQRDQRSRHRTEAWDHARAALLAAEDCAGAASDTGNGNALGWVGIALGWMMLRERDRGGESDG
jgi:hypothetical protein